MNKNYAFVLILFMALVSRTTFAQESQKNYINYQGVARTAGNQLMANEALNIGIGLKFGNAAAAALYKESHSITTDANGVFSLKIGNGDLITGDYNSLPWGIGAPFVTVSINGNEVGTTEMMAVPYAISSGDADDQSAAEVTYDNTSSGLGATNAQAAIDELVTGGMVDADADPTNEFQNLSFDSNTNELSLSDGNAVTIPSGGTDADVDPTNEFQNLSFDSNTNLLSLSDGNAVTIPSGGADADADPTNEIQDITLNGTNLGISGGSTIDLSPIIPPGGTDDQLATEVPYDNSASGLAATNAQTAIDELATGGLVDTDDQNLILTGDVLTIQDGTGLIDLGNYVDDADSDPTNEIDKTTQTGILLGNNTAITGLIGSADGQVPKWNAATSIWEAATDATGSGGGSSFWAQNGSNINYNDGNVGIGTTSPATKLHIVQNATPTNPHLRLEENENDFSRLEFKNNQSSAFWQLAGLAGNTPADSKLNFHYSNANGSADRMTITGVGNVGIGTTNPAARLDIQGTNNANLSNTEGDFRIGSNTHRLKMSVDLTGLGAGTGRIRAHGGSNRLVLGAADKDVMVVDPGGVTMLQDFYNQSVHKLQWSSNQQWIPSITDNVIEVSIPGVQLNIDVPIGSKVLLSFSAEAVIDSDFIYYKINRGNNPIAYGALDCYLIAESKSHWHVDLDGLDTEVTAGSHTYTVSVYHSDDAEDGWWRNITFYAVVIKE